MSNRDVNEVVRDYLFLPENDFKKMLEKEFPNSNIGIEHNKQVSVRITNKETGILEDACQINY